jgi:DNA-binding XRE family transcriptional regulator
LARVQSDPTAYARMRTLAKNVKAMERLAMQLEMARYEESHDLCLKMVEVFKRETGYDSLLRQRMGGESQSGQETS